MEYRNAYTLEDVIAYVDGAPIVAFDFETAPDLAYRDEPKAALDAHKSHIVGVSLSVAEGSAINVPLRHRVGRNADDPEGVMQYLRTALFENTTVIKVAHNLAFESMFLYAQGVVIQPPVYDTIAAAQMTLKAPGQFRSLSDCGLKNLATSLLKAEGVQTFSDLTEGQHFDELDPADEPTLRYACADADYALGLYRRLNTWFDESMPAHRYVVEAIESPTAVYCGIMKYNGLLMDTDAMHEQKYEAEARLATLRSEIDEMTGGVEIGANASTSAFKKYLFGEDGLGLPVMKTTAKMQEAADDQTMIMLAEWCEKHRPELVPLFAKIQEYRRWGKLKATYIEGYLRHVNEATGRIHPDLMPLATETGRFAARNPNLQNMPRKGNDPVGIRSFILAPLDHVLLSLDFSQIELCVGAFYCRDEKMLDTYRTGGDIHAQTTSVIYGIPYDEATDKNAPAFKERRTVAKGCNFGVFFGLFAPGLQRTLKYKAGLYKPLSECEDIIANLKRGYPALVKWQNDIKLRTTHRKYSETALGRRRYLPGIISQDWGKRSFAERCALNTPIQGTAADILKLALGRIVEGLPERPWLKPLLQIHDELVFEVPTAKLGEAMDFVRRRMEAQPFTKYDVPIVAEAAYGDDFGHMREVD